MKKASDDAQRLAVAWCLGLAGGLAVTALLAGLLAWTTLRAVLGPLRELARTAEAVGAGNLNLVVAAADDEVGQAARAFNQMIRQLRDYRQSHSARLLRAQRTGQAVLDSFPDPILVVDPGGAVEMANPAARRVLGVSRPALVERAARRPAAGRRPSRGSRRRRCAARWTTPCASSSRSSRRRSTRRSASASTARNAPTCRRFCPSAIPTATRWGRRWCSAT